MSSGPPCEKRASATTKSPRRKTARGLVTVRSALAPACGPAGAGLLLCGIINPRPCIPACGGRGRAPPSPDPGWATEPGRPADSYVTCSLYIQISGDHKAAAVPVGISSLGIPVYQCVHVHCRRIASCQSLVTVSPLPKSCILPWGLWGT